ncbi:MAG: zinc ribbon domain-containing protein [Wolbachia sp.]
MQSLTIYQRCQYTYCGAYSRNKRYFYYRCSGSRFNGNRICDNKAIRTDALDTVIWEEVKSILKELNRIANEY